MACLPKKTPAARNAAEMPALARPRRGLPWYMASAAFRNQTAAPRYQIQLKLRLTLLWDAPPPTPATCPEHKDAYFCRHRRDGVCSTPKGERTRRRHPQLPCATIPVPVKAGGIGHRNPLLRNVLSMPDEDRRSHGFGTHAPRAGAHSASVQTPLTTPPGNPCARTSCAGRVCIRRHSTHPRIDIYLPVLAKRRTRGPVRVDSPSFRLSSFRLLRSVP